MGVNFGSQTQVCKEENLKGFYLMCLNVLL